MSNLIIFNLKLKNRRSNIKKNKIVDDDDEGLSTHHEMEMEKITK